MPHFLVIVGKVFGLPQKLGVGVTGVKDGLYV
jgi:hypothetical protein